MVVRGDASGYGAENLNVPPGLDGVVMEAKRRFRWCSEWEAQFRPRFIEDIKFENGDSDNGYQWPNSVRKNRDVDQRPCLTMNLIRQHNLNISNEARKNKSSVRVVGTGNGATELSGRAFTDVCRHIEMISKAQDAYTVARGWQIGGGIGWWRIVTRYAREDTFDQEAYIVPVNDPLSVYMDPDIQQKDGSDANFAFVFDKVPREEFKQAYPEFYDLAGNSPLGLGMGDADWISKDYIMICEYFRKVKIPDKVVSFMLQGVRKTILLSKIPKNAQQAVLDDPLTKTRPTEREEIEWYLIAGSQVVDHTVWVGKYIPLVRIIGEEIVIDGVMDRRGHTRSMKDAQRMFNYNASAQVEFVALQGKTPWLAAAEAIEEYETMWNSANVVNHSVLVYNGLDDEGNTIAPPQRQQPPTAAPAYESGMQTAFNQIMMVSGQFQNQMGMQGNERTGKAIDLRQQQSATSVYHFQDNYEAGLRYTSTILIDLIPRIYDTKRVIAIIAEDGVTTEITIDPTAAQAFMQKQKENGEVVSRIFNPRVGQYDVAPSVGPAYGTKREEARDMLALLLTQNKELTPIVGDLLLGDMDFDSAQEASRRLKRMVPPQALGVGPTANETRMQTQIQALTQALAEALQQTGKAQLKLVGKEQMRNIDAYEAETGRMAALKDFLPIQPEGLAAVIDHLVQEALRTNMGDIISANANNIDIDSVGAPEAHRAIMPLGARQAPDGNHYIEDPARKGKWLKIARKAASNG